MILLSLTVHQGGISKVFRFQDSVTIIHSNKNSVGKSTLMRMLIYSLGYPVPSTRGINFANLEFELELEDDSNNQCKLIRHRDSIIYFEKDEEINFSLPSDIAELHQKLFNIKNDEVLDNLLGAFYIDQEKGWTLLNRGTVIGGIKFNLEKLLRGLTNRSDNEALVRLNIVNRELKKYRHMLNIAEYRAELNATEENIPYDAPIDEIESKIDSLLCERKPLSTELERIVRVIRKNSSFKKYISSMQLRVTSSSGEEIPVNEDTLVGFNDIDSLLRAKRKRLETDISFLDKKIGNLRTKQNNEHALLNVQTLIQSFDADVSKMKIDQVTTQRVIDQLTKEQKVLQNILTNNVKVNNPLVGELHSLIKGYALELGVDEVYVKDSKDFIFTSDLKSLSGAILHKIVFSFKVSYIKIIEKQTGLRLPIVMDSPSGRELSEENIKAMMNIVARDFSKHQIIIASIHDNYFPKSGKIEIIDRVLS